MTRSLEGDAYRTERILEEPRRKLPECDVFDARAQQTKTVFRIREQNYHLNPRQASMLRDIGTFRTVTANSLQKHVYQADVDRFRKDLRNLMNQRLLTLQHNPKGNDHYVSLNR